MPDMTNQLPSMPGGRSCANCQCYVRMSPIDGVCMRTPPRMEKVRVPVPRTDAKGHPQIGKDGQPIMVMGEAQAYRYEQTQAGLVCFDGWRPLGTKPGERESEYRVRRLFEALAPTASKLIEALEEDAPPAMREGALPVLDAMRQALAIFAAPDPQPLAAANDEAPPVRAPDSRIIQ